MGLKSIDERLSRVATIINGWSGAKHVPSIERDLALEHLRQIYDEVLGYTPDEEVAEPAIAPAVAPVVVEAPIVEQRVEEPASLRDIVEEFDDALDIDALLGIGAEPEPAVEESAEPIEPIQPVVEEPAESSSEEGSTVGALFALEDIPVRMKRGRKMVQLYNDDYTPRAVVPEPELKPEPKPEPVVESLPKEVVSSSEDSKPAILGEVLRGDVTTLADSMASEEPTTPFNRITELRGAIGLNDRFLMIRDLFGGDVERFEATIDTLDEFEELDECMIYIVENFHWNPDSEAAKLIVSLLERKLA
jgi:hypothetical protein